jgi:biopolymer transport protein ExbD
LKLETSLNGSPRFLHVVPFLGVILLLITFFFLGTNLIGQSGIRAVNLPHSASIIPPVSGRLQTLTLTAGAEPSLYLNNEATSFAQLETQLQNLAPGDRKVMILGDEMAAYGAAVKAGQIALKHGCEIIYATKPAQSTTP